MTFRRGARLDPGQVRDVRGQRFGGRGGMPIAIGGGGGLIGVVLLVLYVILSNQGGTPTDPSGGGGRGLDSLASGDPNSLADCQTGADANARDDCRIVGYVNSIQEYWDGRFAEAGNRYREATTTFFDGPIPTGCGTGSPETGPFYCPTDEDVYIDLGFFRTLRDRFGGSDAPLAQAYVLAHEYGHHVQNLLGDLGARDPGAEGGAVRTELQADCYAGVWAGNAVSTGYLQPISDAQIATALDAAAAVGDDRIQQATGRDVDPHSWTHGSAEQRQEWFLRGFRDADPAACDTFQTEI